MRTAPQPNEWGNGVVAVFAVERESLGRLWRNLEPGSSPRQDARIRLLLGRAHMQLGDEGEARAALDQMIEIATDEQQELIPEARRRVGGGSLRSALEGCGVEVQALGIEDLYRGK